METLRQLKQSIFSWHQKELRTPNQVFRLMEEAKVDTIFQSVSHQDSSEDIRSFLQCAERYEKEVYFLSGDPSWARDSNATKVMKFIELASQYKGPALRGMVLDVEPYLLDEFKYKAKEIMTAYVTGMVKSYRAAKAHQLEMIVCVPYYFDTLGFSAELERIIRDAADAVAIMNYYRGKEREHLRNEAQLSLKYGKPIITIYELQPPGKHGLSDENTYYHQGIPAVYQNFLQVKQAYPHQEVGLSFHEYTYFELLRGRGLEK